MAERACDSYRVSPKKPDADVPPGLLLVDKPGGMTSHDVVARARRALGTRKIGHAGTLDPMATGLLVLGVEGATRLLSFMVGLDKTYEATIRLGVATDTDDADGEVVAVTDASSLTSSRVTDEIAALTGRPSDDWRASVADLHGRGVEHVWLRTGAEGSWMCSRGQEPVHLAAVPATVVDVTGAGDAMLAAWIAAWLGGADPVSAAREGHRAAAATIESPHTVRPDLADVLTSPDPTSTDREEHP